MEKLNVGFKAYRISVCCCLAFTFFVISYGAYTRLTESGLGCPDWPGCFGSIWVHSQDLIQKNNKWHEFYPVCKECITDIMLHSFLILESVLQISFIETNIFGMLQVFGPQCY